MSKILVTGGSGMIGTALKQDLESAVYISSQDYNLIKSEQCEQMYKDHKPDCVIHLAAKVGGIKANMDKLADFYYENTMISTNVLHYAKEYNVKKVLSVLSTCVYPDVVSYPLVEKDIHNGEPHQSNFAYAHVKRMADIQSRAYRRQYDCNFVTIVPNNLFGENDNFDLEDSHVLPAIIRKIYEAKKSNSSVYLWGDGSPLREFTYSKDLSKIILFLLDKYNDETPINVGNTKEYSIKNVANMIAEILDYNGEIVWQTDMPKGQYRKPSDNSKLISLGWKQEKYTDFYESLSNVCGWFEKNYPNIRGI
jgi:GDP-L-fucose synthase